MQGMQHKGGRHRWVPRLLPLSLALIGSTAWAGDSIEFDNGAKIDWSATVSYGVGVRVKDASDKLLAGPLATSNPRAINLDDGNRNFGKGDLTTNRVGLNAEMHLQKDTMGMLLRGTAFYDDVYHKRNDNDSRQTVNKFGAPNEFTDGTKFYSGGRAKLLDAYLYDSWNLGSDKVLSVKLGNQVVSWGESLFYGNTSAAQVPVDAVKGLSPGTEVKEILLPVPQVSALLELSPRFSVMGYYQFQWKGTELPPVGSYLSSTDILGPGAQFLRTGFGAPFGGVSVPDPRVQGKLGANYTPFAGKEDPKDSGQFGLGARWGVSEETELSAYYLQYHDKSPNVRMNYGKMPGCYANPDKFGGAKAACSAAPGTPLYKAYNGTWLPNPLSYNEVYFENIKLVGAALSTRIGDTQVGAELTYRDGVPMLVNTPLGPTAAEGKATQAQVSFVHVLGHRPWASATTLMGELVWTHGISVDDVYGAANLAGLNSPANTGLFGSSDQFVYTTSKNGEVTGERDKNGYGLTLGMDLSYPGIVPGWDLKVPLRAVWVQGMSPLQTLAAADGDFRYSVGMEWKYLGNLELGLSYVGFTRPDPVYRQLGDRDYVSAYAKYSF